MDRLGRQKLLFPVVILTFLLTGTVARAQGVGASGEITGTVTDSALQRATQGDSNCGEPRDWPATRGNKQWLGPIPCPGAVSRHLRGERPIFGIWDHSPKG